MKASKISIVCLAVLFMFMTAGAVNSAPVYYTFSGHIEVTHESAAIISNADIQVGDPIEFVYLVDYDADGYYTRNDGTIVTLSHNDTAGNGYPPHFYAELISGSILDAVNGGYRNAPEDVAMYNYGQEWQTSGPHTALWGGTGNNYSRVSIFRNRLYNWNESDTNFLFYEWAFGNGSDPAYIAGSMTLTRISENPPSAPVPLPSAMILLGTGLVGLAGIRMKKPFEAS